MKFLNILVILAMLGFVSCSGTDKVDESGQASELAENDDLLEDSDFIVDSDDEDLMEPSKEPDDEDSIGDDAEQIASNDEAMEELKEEVVASQNEEPVVLATNSGQYTVEKGDTLMLIAFKVFGDYKKWKTIKRDNRAQLVNGLSEGMVLSYEENGFSWSPNGEAHLIKRGETLGTISSDKYGTQKKWKDIWNNNKPMIKDPNLIFAGFTLYYIPARDLASE